MKTYHLSLVISSGFWGLACGSQTSSPTVANGARPASVVQQKVLPASFESEAGVIRAGPQPPNWGDVERRMMRVVEAEPSHGLAWYNIGVAREQLDRIGAAADAYRRAIVADPKFRAARENLAGLAMRRGDEQEAVGLLRDLVTEDPAAVSARVALARYDLKNGRYAEARQLCKAALTYDPKNIEAYCILGQESLIQKNRLRVRLLADQGLKISTDAACLHELLGQLAHAEGDASIALVHFERAIRIQPRLPAAHFKIGEISLAYRDYNRAAAAFTAVVQLEPRNEAAFINLGIARKASGQLEAAEEAYLTAMQVAKTRPLAAAHFNLGVLYMKYLQRPDDAEREFNTYLRSSPKANPKVRGWLRELAALRAPPPPREPEDLNGSPSEPKAVQRRRVDTAQRAASPRRLKPRKKRRAPPAAPTSKPRLSTSDFE